MFGSSEKLQAKLYTQAIQDIEDLANRYKKTSYVLTEVTYYSRMYKRKLFTHYYSRVKQLA